MRRFVIAAFVAALLVGIGLPGAVGLVVFLALWAGLHVLSPASCPHCHKRAKFLATACRFCGRDIPSPLPR